MAPIKDETVEALREMVHKLESRVQQLEDKVLHPDGGGSARKSKSGADGVRIILMGPPGAGKSP